jgi:transposase-like protein
MDMSVAFQDSTFCVTTQVFSLTLSDTPENRQVAVVVLRCLRDAEDRPLFTLQQVAQIVESEHRQAAGCHVDTFRAGGETFKALVLRQRKVDEVVVEAVRAEVLREPLVETVELCRRVNARLGREDLSVVNIEAALAQISCREVRRVLRGQLERGEAHYTEAGLLETLLQACAEGGTVPAGIEVPLREEPRLVDPTAIRTLLTPGAAMEAVSDTLRWVGVCLMLYYWGVPLSRLGVWIGVHKTTILRWMLGVVGAVWGEVAGWIVERVRGGGVLVDEKWLKIRGRWFYWFVVLDVTTEIPLVTYLSPTRGVWACRWVGVKLRRLGVRVTAVVTDGLAGYTALVAELPGVRHVWCRFHHQQGVTRWCREHLGTTEEAEQTKRAMKQVVQTRDKRTVRRRLAQLAAQAGALGIEGWVTQTLEKLACLLPAIGSRVLPTTTNAIERFFRGFNRFYKGRCGFHSIRSAKWELLLFIVVYLFTQREKDGMAPIEAIVPEARQMPLYRLINDPLAVVLGGDHVTLPQPIAHEAFSNALAA